MGKNYADPTFLRRYIDDQVTHARIELVARIFRSKHGPLLQRLRYTYQKKQGTASSRSDNAFKNSTYLPAHLFPTDYLPDAKPHKLIEEFFILNKELNEQRNPKLGKTKGFFSFSVEFHIDALPFPCSQCTEEIVHEESFRSNQ